MGGTWPSVAINKESQALRSSLAITMKVFICSILLVAVVQGNPKDRFI